LVLKTSALNENLKRLVKFFQSKNFCFSFSFFALETFNLILIKENVCRK
jgi:hypothetical protein